MRTNTTPTIDNKTCQLAYPIESEPHVLQMIALADAFSALLAGWEKAEANYLALPARERTPKIASATALDMLSLLEPAMLQFHPDGLHAPISNLVHALESVGGGNTHRMVSPKRTGSDSFGASERSRIKAISAALIQWIIETKNVPQAEAAQRVVEALEKGGYSAPGAKKKAADLNPDTIKRWHNSAQNGKAPYQGKFRIFLNYYRQTDLAKLPDHLATLVEVCRRLALA